MVLDIRVSYMRICVVLLRSFGLDIFPSACHVPLVRPILLSTSFTGLDDERGIEQIRKRKLNVAKRGTIGGLDLPEGRELQEDILI